jgi:hypothetical protein
VRYLGCEFAIGERDVRVYAPDGRRIATVRSVSTARRVARGYRRAA